MEEVIDYVFKIYLLSVHYEQGTVLRKQGNKLPQVNPNPKSCTVMVICTTTALTLAIVRKEWRGKVFTMTF